MADGTRDVSLEFLAAFDCESGDSVEVETFGNFELFKATEFFYLLTLTLNITFVLKVDLHRLHNLVVRNTIQAEPIKSSTWNIVQNVT